MALLDRGRCYVAVNDAFLDLFQCRREDVIGSRASATLIGAERSARSESWDQMLASGELYGEHVVTYPERPPMRVSYAAHASRVDGQWLALFVTLSARVEPGGAELISTSLPATHSLASAALTAREREVVHRVALGATSRQIASDLFLSPATVRSHIRNAMTKANAHTRAQLVAIVLGEGLTDGKGQLEE
jgi:DNA-binding CsgD family transcriptional regulator